MEKGVLFGLDIGGTLVKICFNETSDATIDPRLLEFLTESEEYGRTGHRDKHLSIAVSPAQRLHFIVFETSRIVNAIELIREHNLTSTLGSAICATGGGAHKYERDIKRAQGLGLNDEIGCLVRGLDFLLRNDPNQVYSLQGGEKAVKASPETLWPFLVVNVGTGVSIIRANSSTDFQRVSGSGIGGGTYWGLARLLTKVESFQASLDLTEHGSLDATSVTVGDIYGQNSYLGLDSDMIAAFLARSAPRVENGPGPSDADILKGLLMMVTNNIAQIAYINAQKEGVDTIFFAGNFFRRNDIAMKALDEGIRFWSGGEKNALFLRHEGYFGAVGSLLS